MEEPCNIFIALSEVQALLTGGQGEPTFSRKGGMSEEN
jgi:hypothetical protein